jgi:hypothetical protein
MSSTDNSGAGCYWVSHSTSLLCAEQQQFSNQSLHAGCNEDGPLRCKQASMMQLLFNVLILLLLRLLSMSAWMHLCSERGAQITPTGATHNSNSSSGCNSHPSGCFLTCSSKKSSLGMLLSEK